MERFPYFTAERRAYISIGIEFFAVVAPPFDVGHAENISVWYHLCFANIFNIQFARKFAAYFLIMAVIFFVVDYSKVVVTI